MEFDGGLGFGAGFVGGGALLADLGQAGVGGGALGVGGDGGVELLFGFGEQALAEIVVAELDVLRGSLGGGQGLHGGGADLVELEGGLAEGGFGVGAADALEGDEVGGVFGDGADGFASGYVGAELFGFVVGGVELEGEVDFALGGGEVSAAVEGDGEVVVVVGVVGIGVGGALEERDGVLAKAAGGYGLVVDDLGEREAAGYEGEGGFGVRVFGGVEAGEAEIEAGFESYAVVGRDAGEGGGGVLVVALDVLGFCRGLRGRRSSWGSRRWRPGGA